MKQLLITIAAVVLVGCKKPEPPDISIHEATKEGNIEAVKQHIAAGTYVNAMYNSRTPLYWAALGGHKEITELLIAAGANVNAKDMMGNFNTPLHCAVLEGQNEIAELLIAKGADVNAKNDGGETPLDGADGEIADLIRKHGGKTGEELKAEGK